MRLKSSLRVGLYCLCINLFLLGSGFGFEDIGNSDLERELLAALQARRDSAYLQTGDNELRVLESSGEKVVFQKVKDGLDILGNVVEVYHDENARIDRVEDDSTQWFKTGGKRAAIESAEAIAVAVATLNELQAMDSETELVWFRMADVGVLAWQVETRLAHGDAPVSPTLLQTAIDATTGEILSQNQIDTNVYAADPETGTGVFPRRIVINDTVGPAGAQAFALGFPEVCSIPGCTATLIAPNVALSARHCGSAPGDFVRFGPDRNAPIFSTTVQSVILPAGSGTLLDGGDVAILCLNDNVPAGVATPMRLIDATTSLVGSTAATIGYGFNGVGSTGHMFTADGLRWGGENVIDVYGVPADNSGTNIFSTDFDDGTVGNNTIPGGSQVPVTNEATTAPGDSGGPLVVNIGGENLICGVLSGGTTATSVFGDISWWTGTSNFRTQIEAKGGEFSTGGGTPPPNDNFASTISLGGALPVSTTGDNFDATTEAGEQELEMTGATVWWFFTAPETGMVTVDTFGSDFDTVLHIYDGWFAGAGPGDINPVANNDQAGGTDQSQVTFPVVAGEFYEIRVGGFFGAEGNIMLNVQMGDPNPPPNDNFVDTILISGFPFTEMGDNFNATTEAGEQNLDITSATVWWFFTAPEDGDVTVDTFGSDFDTVLTIYEGFFPGAGPGDLIFVTENDQAGGTNQSEVVFPVVGGECYEIRVGGFFGDEGNITLNGILEPNAAVPGDCNGDGEVNLLDVGPFVEAISGGGDPCADINGDGSVDLLDVGPFIELLGGG